MGEVRALSLYSHLFIYVCMGVSGGRCVCFLNGLFGAFLGLLYNEVRV